VAAILRKLSRKIRLMIPNAIIDQITDAISKAMPKGIADDARKQINAVLATRLEQLGLVSREEFDVQAALLEKLRARVDTLESELAQLEQNKKAG